MKIAIPSTSETIDSLVSDNLGRSPFISIYDDETQEHSFFVNTGFQLQDGSGLKAAEIIIQNNANVLLTREIGRKAYSVLMKERVDIQLLSSSGTIKFVIKKYLKKAGR
jgi:predicted Fe-Mo cluster-binding NifX family protein